MGDQFIREGDIKFAKPLPRALLRDARLSWGARGLFAFLWDLPSTWSPNIKHLSGMGPDGRDAVRARLAELEAVGALRIEPIRADGGQLAGKRWVLVCADRWAREAPLSNGSAPKPVPGDVSTEERISPSSANSRMGKSATKVLRNQGSPKTTTTMTCCAATSPHPLVVEEDLAELLEALTHEGHACGKHKPGAWAMAAIRRIRENGAGLDDLALLASWRAGKAAKAEHSARLAAPPPGMPASPHVSVPCVPPPGWDAPVR